MRSLRYSINITLDGCCHHEAGPPPDEELMRYWTAQMDRCGFTVVTPRTIDSLGRG